QASGGSLRWNDPDRFHGCDLSRVSAAPQAVGLHDGHSRAVAQGSSSRGPAAPATSRYGSVTQQTRTSQPYRHHHRRADEDARLGAAVGETITVHDRADGLAEIE